MVVRNLTIGKPKMTKHLLEQLSPPPASKLLGWTLLRIDEEAGEIEVQFEGKPEFVNPAGFIQGGMLAAMLDDTVGPIVLVKTGYKKFATTIDLHVHYLKPVSPGKIRTFGKVNKLGNSISFLEAELFDADGQLCARAVSSAKMINFQA